MFADAPHGTGIRNRRADDEHGGDGNHGRVAEAWKGFLRRDEPRQGKCEKDKDADHVHAYPLRREEDDGGHEDGQDQGDFHGNLEKGCPLILWGRRITSYNVCYTKLLRL